MKEEIKQRIVAKTGKIKSFNNSIGVEYGVRGRLYSLVILSSKGSHAQIGEKSYFQYQLFINELLFLSLSKVFIECQLRVNILTA